MSGHEAQRLALTREVDAHHERIRRNLLPSPEQLLLKPTKTARHRRWSKRCLHRRAYPRILEHGRLTSFSLGIFTWATKPEFPNLGQPPHFLRATPPS